MVEETFGLPQHAEIDPQRPFSGTVVVGYDRRDI
jgi:hypothetical protein